MQVNRDILQNVAAQTASGVGKTPGEQVVPETPSSASGGHDGKSVDQSIQNLSKHLDRMHDTQFQMEFDKDIDRVIVKYVSHATGEVVRQIPTEKFVEFEKEFVKMVGLLYDQKA